MLTKTQKRAVASLLQDKRARDREALYVVEGDKLVREALAAGCAVESIYAVREWADDLPADVARRVVEVTSGELRQLSAQTTPNGALAVLRRPIDDAAPMAFESHLVCVLESVQDPGNLGSLLRAAAWFGVEDVVVSSDSADPFGPKVVQASMGALFRVRTRVRDAVAVADDARRRGVPVYAATPDGEPLYDADLEPRGLVLFGNESRGLSGELLSRSSRRLAIPPWGDRGPGKDSLNVAAAAAVVLSEFRRTARPSGGGSAARPSTMAHAR